MYLEEIQEESKSILETYTGSELVDYINTELQGVYNKRDFVDMIHTYLNQKGNRRVVGVAGLRGVGKTTGLLQSIQDIDDYENTVYIRLKRNAQGVLDFNTLYNMIVDRFSDKRNIFIDEITYCADLIGFSDSLYEDLITRGINVVICGTDSYALELTRGDSLYHRMYLLRVTFISYEETKRTVGINSFNEYLQMGGLYKADKIEDIDGLCEYINTSVLDNIMHTLENNESVTALTRLERFRNNKEKLRVVIYDILCAIVYSLSNKAKAFNANFMLQLFDKNSTKVSLINHFAESLDIDTTVVLQRDDIVPVVMALKRIGLIQDIPNLYDTSQLQYYIVNQTVFNQLTYTMFSSARSIGAGVKSNSSIANKRGLLFESMIINHTIAYTKEAGYNVYYYHDDEDKEIDLVVEKENFGDDWEDNPCVFCELKLTANKDKAVSRAKWINDKSINVEGSVVARYILYSGETQTFDSYDDEYRKNLTDKQVKLEEQNKDIQLISVEDYLSDMKKYLGVLDNYV